MFLVWVSWTIIAVVTECKKSLVIWTCMEVLFSLCQLNIAILLILPFVFINKRNCDAGKKWDANWCMHFWDISKLCQLCKTTALLIWDDHMTVSILFGKEYFSIIDLFFICLTRKDYWNNLGPFIIDDDDDDDDDDNCFVRWSINKKGLNIISSLNIAVGSQHANFWHKTKRIWA